MTSSVLDALPLHGGRILDEQRLAKLIAAHAPTALEADDFTALRKALVDRSALASPGVDAVAAVADAVLARGCHLAVGWRSERDPNLAETLLDGARWEPRRRWVGMEGELLPVFVTTERELGGRGRARRDLARTVEYLRRRRLPLAVLTNGAQLRLLYADTDSTAWAEWPVDALAAGDATTPAFEGLRTLLQPATLRGVAPAYGALVEAIRASRRGEAELSARLGENVRLAVETLLHARQSVVAPLWSDARSADLYRAACRVVMRLVVVLFAEARGLFPRDNALYEGSYGLLGLRERLERMTAARRATSQSAWPRLLALFRLLYDGSDHARLMVPRYEGELFERGATDGDERSRCLAALESPADAPTDADVHAILRLLTRTTVTVREGKSTRRVEELVDFSELTSEYLGILYEGLLDYDLKRAGDGAVVLLALGDEPALGLDHLEALTDPQVKALVERLVKESQKSSTPGEEEGDDDEPAEAPPDADAEEGTPTDAPDEGDDPTATDADDPRAGVRVRALAWARRAARLGGLTRKRKKGESDVTWEAQAQRDAERLVPPSRVKLPGQLYLVRWGGTRKGAGTYYTRPQLTLPTVRRALAPLLFDDAGAIRPPEDLLALKVCDPAMGSGSFLVAALRVLTEALVRSLHTHGRIVSADGHTRLALDALAPDDALFTISASNPTFPDELRARLARAVVEHCLYGVDKDTLAVELARVALWIETLDPKLPFTFLDHKLRPGNSLVGAWLDHFRFYPLAAWWRESPDKHHVGVHHQGAPWAKALEVRRKVVAAEVGDYYAGQRLLGTAAEADDKALREALEAVQRLYRELRKVPSWQPSKRREFYEKVRAHDGFKKVREAFDRWCALWFWPLDEALAAAPSIGGFLEPSEPVRTQVERLRQGHQFFHWELEFPDVFDRPGSGFDAVIGNPPWEIAKPNSKEFFSNRDPLYRTYGKTEALRRQRELFTADADFETAWLDELGRHKNLAHWLRASASPFGDGALDGERIRIARKAHESETFHARWAAARARVKGHADPAHPYRLQGSADLNLYKMFAELGLVLLRSAGSLGLIVPSGLYTDQGARDLRTHLLERCDWRWLFSFENRRKIFNIHASFKFAVVIATKGAVTTAVQAAFMRWSLDDWSGGDDPRDDPARRLTMAYPADDVARFSPRNRVLLEITSAHDLALLGRLYEKSVLLGAEEPGGWAIRYAGELHMTNDAKLFPGREVWEEKGYAPDGRGRWVGPDGDVALPVYEGRMIGQHDPSQKAWVRGKGRTAVWDDVPWRDKRVMPQFLMGLEAWRERCRPDEDDPRTEEEKALVWTEPKVGFMDIASATNARTMYATPLAGFPCGNKVPTLRPGGGDAEAILGLAGVLNSFTYDWVLRQRLGGLTLNYFVIEETPLPSRETLSPWIGLFAGLLTGGIAPLQLLLWQTRYVLPEGWRWALTEHERMRVACILDALVAYEYGLTRDELRWILRDCDHPVEVLGVREFRATLDPKGFWRIDAKHPPLRRQTVLTQVAFEALLGCVEAAKGDREEGLEQFCTMGDGTGWQLPPSAQEALGPRFFPEQMVGSEAEDWAAREEAARVWVGDAVDDDAPLTPQSYFSTQRAARTSRQGEAPVALADDAGWSFTASWFRALERAAWAPEGVSVLVGPNGAGKSTLLRVLAFLRDLYQLGMSDAVQNLGGAVGLKHLGATAEQPVEIALTLGPVTWSLVLPILDGGVAGSWGETVTVSGVVRAETRALLLGMTLDGNPVERSGPCAFEQLVRTTGDPLLRQVVERLHALRVHPPWSLEQLRKYGRRDDAGVLFTNGSNLWPLLKAWHDGAERGRYDAIVATLGKAFPGVVRGFVFEEVGETVSARYVPGGEGMTEARLPLSTLADGVLTATATLAAVHGAPERALVGLDECESNLHPHAIRVLMAAVREEAERRGLTVVCATHSPVLLDVFRKEPERVWVMERGRPSQPVRLTEVKEEAWLVHFDLGELYVDMEYGAPEVPPRDDEDDDE